MNPGDAMALYRLGDAYTRQTQLGRGHRRPPEVASGSTPTSAGPTSCSGKRLHEEGPARDRRGHAAPGHPVRPQQQVRALPARPAPAAGRAAPTRRSGSWRSPSGSRRARAALTGMRAAPGGFSPSPRSRLAPRRLPTPPGRSSLVDVAARAGLARPVGLRRPRAEALHHRDQRGGGRASSTYDGDGWVDALVLNGTRLEDGARQDEAWPAEQAPTSRLYRNNRDGTFADVTDGVGPRPHGLGLGGLRGRLRQRRRGSTCS